MGGSRRGNYSRKWQFSTTTCFEGSGILVFNRISRPNFALDRSVSSFSRCNTFILLQVQILPQTQNTDKSITPELTPYNIPGD